MRSVQFHLLARLTIHHEYYHGGFIRNLKVIPDAKTLTFMTNAGLVFKPQSSGFEIYRPITFDKAYINELTSFFGDYFLCFQLYSQHPRFFIFTDTSLDELALFSFNNKSVEDEGTLVPTLEPNISFAEYFGTAKFYLDQFIEGDELASRHYQIKFKARPTQINYLIANMEPGAKDQFIIEDSEGNQFEPPQRQQQTNGQDVYNFSSGEKKYKIQERELEFRSLRRIQREEGNNDPYSEIIIDKLPSPSPDSLTNIKKLATSDEDVACSTLYIYL